MTSIPQPARSAQAPPPHTTEAEQGVLGSMLLEREAAERAVVLLTSADFYGEAHHRIFDAILDLRERGTPIDLITVTDRLKARGHLEDVGGAGYVTSLLDAVPTAANVEYYARLVLRDSLLRQAAGAGAEVWSGISSGSLTDPAQAAALLADFVQTLRERDGQSPGGQAATPLTAAEILQLKGEPVAWGIEGLVPMRGITLVAAEVGRQKTWLLLDAGISIATGRPLFGAFTVPRPRPVLFLEEEMHDEPTADRLRRLGLPGDTPLYLFCKIGFRFDDPEWARWLREIIRRLSIEVIIADSLTRMHRIEENKAGEVNAFYLDYLDPLASEFGVAILLSHHANKPGPPGTSTAGRHRIRGSGDWVAIAENAYYLRAYGGGILVSCEKSRYAPEGKPFALRLVDQPDGSIRFVYEGPAEEIVGKEDAAREAIVTLVTEQPGLPTETIIKYLKGNHAEKTLRRALTALEGKMLDPNKEGRKNRWRLLPEVSNED